MSLVALALPQDPLRMKTMADKSDISPVGETPIVYVASEPVIPSKKDKKDKSKHKKKQATKILVQTSATASISIAISDPSAVLVRSAPSSPETFLKPRRHGRGLKLRNRSKASANSDPETSCPSVSPSPSPSPASSPNRRPLFLWPRKLGGKGRRNGSREVLNGPKTPNSRPESPNVVDRFGSGSSIEPEATLATNLPGGRGSKLETRHSGGDIPTIYVSHEHNGCVELEVDVPDESRKMSQTSVGSTHNSANSGYCTLSATGSGDEGGSFSDIECPSPISPSSVISSHGGSVPNLVMMSIDTAQAAVAKRTSSSYPTTGGTALSPDSEPDFPRSGDTSSPVATPTTPLSAPLSMSMSVSPLPGPRGVSPPTEGATKSPGRCREPFKKRGPWEKVRKFVQALSPFTLQFNKKKYAWVQLAGHQDSFRPGDKAGSIQKKSDLNESSALKALSMDSLRPFVPEYIQTVTKDGQLYVEMADLLREFTDPAVMDIKMGVRTYLEDELEKARTKKVLRQDMYKKMIEIDHLEPTPEENSQQAITKPRYMQWRETISSSSSLGFRIEGIKTSEGKALKDFKTTRSEYDVKTALRDFLSENPCVKEPFLKRLRDIRSALEQSEFFCRHEVIGSSLLFVYDSTDLCSVHLIDFGKTIPLPPGITIDHRSPWVEGNHEDGYLWGLDNLIRLWSEIRCDQYTMSPSKHRSSYGRSNSAIAL